MKGGVCVVDKPIGPTSFDVVARARRAFGTRSIGHAGTLDPLAQGVLVVLIDDYTKLQRVLMDHDKFYRGSIALGTSTTTDDRGGEVVDVKDASALTIVQVTDALATFLGAQLQTPPAYSAVHIDGERAYQKARRGEAVTIAARGVTFHALALRSYDAATCTAVVDVHCSKGTYIRSLARDLGAALGVPAHLSALVRTASGGFTLAQAMPAQDLSDPARAASHVLTGAHAYGGIATIAIDAGVRDALKKGQRPAWELAFSGLAIATYENDAVALVHHDGERIIVDRGL